MKTPYGIEIIENCLSCPLHKDRLFCDLNPAALAGLDSISSPATYPKGAILFVEGQQPRGVFVICTGQVKLSASSAGGKSIILRVASPGELIGLPGTISGKPYEATAEALEPVQANFIPGGPFLAFLRTHGEAALRVAETLTDIYYAAYREVRCLGLTRSVEEKLASFLLDFTAGNASADVGSRATLTLTHEEIAGMIGTKRETVTRLFSTFKRKGLIQVRGSSLVIADKAGLQKLLQA
jgi:CRP/FNR family transcriptional regulator